MPPLAPWTPINFSELPVDLLSPFRASLTQRPCRYMCVGAYIQPSIHIHLSGSLHQRTQGASQAPQERSHSAAPAGLSGPMATKKATQKKTQKTQCHLVFRKKIKRR